MRAVSNVCQMSYIFFKRILILCLTRNKRYTKQQKQKQRVDERQWYIWTKGKFHLP